MLGYTDQHRNEKENISIYIYIYVCNIIHIMTLEYTICVMQETLVEKKKGIIRTIIQNFVIYLKQ